MTSTQFVYDRLSTFKHGVHPEEFKHFTERLPIQRMPFVEEYIIPLTQHIGAPSKSLVDKGQKVKRGQMIAAPGGFVSVGQHSPVTGTVVGVGLYEHPGGGRSPGIKIKADPFSPQIFEPQQEVNWKGVEQKDFLRLIQESGLVGLGGAAFPSHVKFAVPQGKKCQFIIINGCECEPYLTSDHRLMVEFPERLLSGTKILLELLGAEKAYVGIEANKPDAIGILKDHCSGADFPVEVVPLEVKYPQGAEKMLITAVLKREVPSGKLPIDVGTVVANVGTTAALAQYSQTSQPLIERVVTVTGPGIEQPSNLMVPLGTPLAAVIEFCGGLKEETSRILLGGPMMGLVQKGLHVPVIKGTSGILALTDAEIKEIKTYNCIRCGRCIDACPVFLNPSYLGLMARKGLFEEMESMNLMDCMECACCSFVCPSGIPLVQSFRVAKSLLREKKSKK